MGPTVGSFRDLAHLPAKLLPNPRLSIVPMLAGGGMYETGAGREKTPNKFVMCNRVTSLQSKCKMIWYSRYGCFQKYGTPKSSIKK